MGYRSRFSMIGRSLGTLARMMRMTVMAKKRRRRMAEALMVKTLPRNTQG